MADQYVSWTVFSDTGIVVGREYLPAVFDEVAAKRWLVEQEDYLPNIIPIRTSDLPKHYDEDQDG